LTTCHPVLVHRGPDLGGWESGLIPSALPLASPNAPVVRMVTRKVQHQWLHKAANELDILRQRLSANITVCLHDSLIPRSLSVPDTPRAEPTPRLLGRMLLVPSLHGVVGLSVLEVLLRA
jgi:hypothetical protein